MIHVQRRIRLDPPPSEVFAYLTDVERIPEWQAEAGIKRVTRSGGTDLTWTVDRQPPGLWRLMSPVIRRAIDKAADVDFANLQRKLARS